MNPMESFQLGVGYFGAADYAAAKAAFERLEPDWLERDINVSKCLSYLGEPHQALAHAEKAIAELKFNPEAYEAKAFALERMGRFEDALECHGAAIGINPNNPDYWRNLAHGYSQAGRHTESVSWYKDTINRFPQDYTARVHLSMVQLLLEQWEEGLANYEFRSMLGNTVPLTGKPIWNGEYLDGKTLAIFQEQGIGDAVQFIRYAQVIRKEFGAGRILLYCSDPLYRLMQFSCCGIDEVHSTSEQGTPYDVAFPLMSVLGIMHRTGHFTGPDHWPYFDLAPCNQSERLRIGVCWKGNPAHLNDYWRSAKLEDFTPLFGLDADLVSLQYGCRDEALQFGMDVSSPVLTDMQDVAETIAGLDAVVTVDTAVAHLAGAVGVPTYVLLPPNPDWRWGLKGDETAWYPSVTLIRLERFGDYSSGIREIVRRIRG